MKTNADYVCIDRQTLIDYVGNTTIDEMNIADWIEENELGFLTIPEFQKDMVQNSMRWFPDAYANGIDLTMLILGIAGEAGEVADVFKKIVRGSLTREEGVEKIAEETIDLFHYICLIWVALQIDPGYVYAQKTEENEKRFGPKVES